MEARSGVLGSATRIEIAFHFHPRPDPSRLTASTSTSSSTPLSSLRPGCEAEVVEVDPTLALGRRLLDLGFVPGTRVRVLRAAPLGDPVVYELRGTQLCLRRGEADQILVHVTDPS